MLNDGAQFVPGQMEKHWEDVTAVVECSYRHVTTVSLQNQSLESLSHTKTDMFSKAAVLSSFLFSVAY